MSLKPKFVEVSKQYLFSGILNTRSHPEVTHDGHIGIKELKMALQDQTVVQKIMDDFKKIKWNYNLRILDYLNKDIPNFPSPIEFHISEVSHVTPTDVFEKILKSEGFNAAGAGYETFSWWSLKIDEDSIKAAEERFLEEEFPNRSQEQRRRQEPFLSKFTKSAAFKNQESRYGNVRFTFTLQKLMEAYKEQKCGGQEPVLREYKTMFYKQEIVYVVLIHSPDDNNMFENFSMIEKSEIVNYENNKIVWRAQAIGEENKCSLILNQEDKVANVEYYKYPKYYVWDHVCLAFHFNDVLKFPQETLMESYTRCDSAEVNLAKDK